MASELSPIQPEDVALISREKCEKFMRDSGLETMLILTVTPTGMAYEVFGLPPTAVIAGCADMIQEAVIQLEREKGNPHLL